jgi:hypothetical protein
MEGGARASVPSDAAASPGYAEGKRHAEWKQRVRVGLILLAILVCEQTHAIPLQPA